MNRGKKWVWASLILMAVTVLVPMAGSVPQVLPRTSSTYSTTVSDFILLECATNVVSVMLAAHAPSQIVITAPSGEQISFTYQPSEICEQTPIEAQCEVPGLSQATRNSKYRLDGTLTSGNNIFGASGNVLGAAGDGTWIINMESQILPPGVNLNVCLRIQNKGYAMVLSPSRVACVWNQHQTGAGTTYNPSQTCAELGFAQESPDSMVFYNDQTAPDNEPGVFTTTQTVTCPGSVTVGGSWIRGATQVGNTFVRFVTVEGPVGTDLFLSDNLGAAFTPLVDDGAGATGDHSALVSYNNVVGTSYQFLGRAGMGGGEEEGLVLFAPPNQCQVAPVSPSGFSHDENMFKLAVSQAQCRDDKVSFVITTDQISSVGHIANVTVYNGLTGLAVLRVDESQMFVVASNADSERVNFFNRTFTPGPYMALALLERTSVGAQDFFDAEPFNVPSGTCLTPGDKTDLDDHCIPLQVACGGSGGSFIQGTTLGQTTVENVVLLLLAFLVVWYIWAKTTEWGFKFIMPLMMVVLFLATLSFVDKWQPLGYLAAMIAFSGAGMLFRSAYDFGKGRRDRAEREAQERGKVGFDSKL